MQQFHTYKMISMTVLAIALCGAAFANDVNTSFEFNDVDGVFTLGTSPNSATFLNGRAQTVGIPGLYRTGSRAWMIPAGVTGTITFESPGESVNLFIRDQFNSNAGVLTVFDTGGAVITTVNATTVYQNVNVTIDPKIDVLIGSITLSNNGVSGWTVMDSFTYCAAPPAGPAPLDDPIPGPIAAGDVHIALEVVASGLTAPNWGISAPDDPNRRLFVTDQPGILWAIDLDTNTKSVFLDVSNRLIALGIAGPGTFDERGLLGVAFHRNYQNNGLLYTYESHPVDNKADFSTMPAGTPANHQTVITEWQVAKPASPESVVNTKSAREILRIDQPQFNHNAGAMNFGPDGLLYIALGDGGAGDDQGAGHVAIGNGQDTANILGTVIRIDPQGNNSANGQYGIPADNPFVGGPGVDEIYAFGLRNPFRFSFDTKTGNLWLADAGQNDIEEVDVVNKGDNLGWPVKEGSFLFDMNGGDPGFVFADSPGVPADMVDPVAQYDHDEGVVVLGGFVYRGSRIEPLQGKYVFGEFLSRLFFLDGASAMNEFQFVDPAGFQLLVLGFGEDADGELYVMANATGTPFENTGVVLRITTKRGDLDASGTVDVFDLLDLLDAWGDCPAPCPPTCPADITDAVGGQPDCAVNVFDLLELLANWG